MRYFKKLKNGAMLIGIAVSIAACDFSGGGGGTDFNSSQGVSVNWTGVYFGSLGGGKAVSGPSRGNITRLVLSQGGNTIEIVDNQGSRYVGTVGAPGVVGRPDVNGIFSESALLVQSQITWTGKDEVAARDIEFVGVIHIIAVDDIQGRTDNRSRTTTDNNTSTTTRDVTAGFAVAEQTVTNDQGVVAVEMDGDLTTINNNSVQTDNGNRTITRSTTFFVTEANSQFRLQGTWIEQGGGVFEVQADSSGGIATIVTGDTGGADTGG